MPILTSDLVVDASVLMLAAYEDDPRQTLVNAGWAGLSDQTSGSIVYSNDNSGTFGWSGSGAFVAWRASDRTLAVSFEGTQGPELNGWISNLGAGVNSWEPLYDSFRTFIDFVREQVDSLNPSRILVTGHSQGGAMAESFLDDHSELYGDRLIGVTFASPGIVDSLSEYGTDRLLRVEHTGDLVSDIAEAYWNGSFFGPPLIGLTPNPAFLAAFALYPDAEVDLKVSRPEGSIGLTEHNQFLYQDSVYRLFLPSFGERLLEQYARIAPVMLSHDGGTQSFGDGADLIIGGGGQDFVFGQAGADTLGGWGGYDSLFGGSGNDWLDGGSGNDTLFGGENDDRLHGGDHDDLLRGESEGDTLYGGSGNDELYGDEGNDLLNGEIGNDIVRGGTGNDRLFGGEDDDSLRGEGGNDTLAGGPGSDTLSGGNGDDIFAFSNGANSLFSDRIEDYRQSGGSYSATERDLIDLSDIDFATGSGNGSTSTVRLRAAVASDGVPAGAILEINNGDGIWRGIAQLDGLAAGQSVEIALSQTQAQQGVGTIFVVGSSQPEADWTISASSNSVNEGNTITFTVTRPEVTQAATYYVSTVQSFGSSNNGDYEGLLNLPIVFAAGVASVTVTVATIESSTPEPTETFGLIVQSSPDAGADLQLAVATFSIRDDDVPAAGGAFTDGDDFVQVAPTSSNQVLDALGGDDFVYIDSSASSANLFFYTARFTQLLPKEAFNP